MSKEVTAELFKYLCEISRSGLGYNLYKLVEQIEFYREVPKLNHDLTDVVMRMNKFTNNFSNYFKDQNNLKPLGKAFDFLSISEEFQVSVVEISRKIKNYYGNIDKKHLSNLIKLLDTEKLGLIKYNDFYARMFKHILDYEHSLVLHLQYLNKRIKKEYEGDNINFLQSKGIDYNNFLKEGDFYEKFKEYFFKDLVLIKKFVDSIKEKGGKNIGTINCLNMMDMITNSEETVRTFEFDSSNVEKNFDILSVINRIEKSCHLKSLYEYLDPTSVNMNGKVSCQIVKEILIGKMGCKQEETYYLIEHFSSLNILFDLLEFSDFLQINSAISVQEIEIINSKIKDAVMKVSSVSSALFLKKYNLDQFHLITLPEILVILPSVFKITKYETIVIFLDTLRNPLNNLRKMMLSLDLIFQINGIYDLFPSPAKKIKLDGYIKQTLKKLYEFMGKSGNIDDFFQLYDKDKNGVLSREEFLYFLTHYDEHLKLTDSEKIMIIKIADINNDCSVNFPEFVKFLDLIKNEFPPSDRALNPESSSITKNQISKTVTIPNRSPQIQNLSRNIDDIPNFKPIKNSPNLDANKIDYQQRGKINQKLLNEVILFNRSNESSFDPFCSILFKIQTEILEDMNKYTKTIEELFVYSVHDNLVPLGTFVNSLEKCK